MNNKVFNVFQDDTQIAVTGRIRRGNIGELKIPKCWLSLSSFQLHIMILCLIAGCHFHCNYSKFDNLGGIWAHSRGAAK